MVAAVTIRENGVAEMAYVGEKPWHGLGAELQSGADISTWRRAAGMDWSILAGAVNYSTPAGQCEMPGQQVLYRSDNQLPLAVVSNAYKVVQPADVLEFFSDLADDNGFTLETAGTLFQGRRFWALASINEHACVVGNDAVGGYLLLSTSCDGTLTTNARFTSVRVVCHNTLTMARKGKADTGVTIRHNTAFKANKVKDELGIARDSFGSFMKSARTLAAKSMSKRSAEKFVEDLLVDAKFNTPENVRKSRQFNRILDLFQGSGVGAELQGAEGTAWGLVNAVTEFVDHHTRARTSSARLANAWFGRGDDLKTQSFERALAL
jgi:phage/plasmid-like protein (TIGR03299 family)